MIYYQEYYIDEPHFLLHYRYWVKMSYCVTTLLAEVGSLSPALVEARVSWGKLW